MKILMKKTEKGSVDGLRSEVFRAGNEYDIADELAKVFIDIGSAKEVKEQSTVLKSRALRKQPEKSKSSCPDENKNDSGFELPKVGNEGKKE